MRHILSYIIVIISACSTERPEAKPYLSINPDLRLSQQEKKYIQEIIKLNDKEHIFYRGFEGGFAYYKGDTLVLSLLTQQDFTGISLTFKIINTTYEVSCCQWSCTKDLWYNTIHSNLATNKAKYENNDSVWLSLSYSGIYPSLKDKKFVDSITIKGTYNLVLKDKDSLFSK